jgi:hypothetical protein
VVGHVGVEVIKAKVWDEDLQVERLKVVGYVGRCPCGYPTRLCRSWNAARRAILTHKAHEHGHRPQLSPGRQ